MENVDIPLLASESWADVDIVGSWLCKPKTNINWLALADWARTGTSLVLTLKPV